MSMEVVNLHWNVSAQRLDETPTTFARSTDRFLQLSQVPLDWLHAAAQLPGKTLAVGLAIWALAIAVKKKTVMATPDSVKDFGVDAATKSRALAALAKAGLITVESRKGRFPIVTLVIAHEISHPIAAHERCVGDAQERH